MDPPSARRSHSAAAPFLPERGCCGFLLCACPTAPSQHCRPPRSAVLHGSENHFTLHRGSPLLLLLLFLADHHAFWTCLLVVHSRPVTRWAAVALPVMALLPRVREGARGGCRARCTPQQCPTCCPPARPPSRPVLPACPPTFPPCAARLPVHLPAPRLPPTRSLQLLLSGGPCSKLLASVAPSVLDKLFTVLFVVHCAPLWPVMPLLLRGPQEDGPSQALLQCRYIDHWLLATVGAALPLIALQRLDAADKCRRNAAERRAASTQQQRQQRQLPAEEEEGEEERLVASSLGDASLASSPLLAAYLARCELVGCERGRLSLPGPFFHKQRCSSRWRCRCVH